MSCCSCCKGEGEGEGAFAEKNISSFSLWAMSAAMLRVPDGEAEEDAEEEDIDPHLPPAAYLFIWHLDISLLSPLKKEWGETL